MELKVGMYVRYRYYIEQKIGLINFIKHDELIDEDFVGLTNYDLVLEGNILKVSDSLIDLIEVGDYVNGYLVTGFDYQCSPNKKVVFSNVRLDGTGIKIPAKDIKSIVTKEQFASAKYEVE